MICDSENRMSYEFGTQILEKVHGIGIASPLLKFYVYVHEFTLCDHSNNFLIKQ